MKNNFVTLIILLLTLSAFSQETGYAIFGTQTNPHSRPHFLITLDTLNEARTLNDIHARYPSSWVASYISVEVSTTIQGIAKKAAGTNDTLTHEQLSMLKMADADSRIEVVVDYIPENTLTYNPPRTMRFSLRMVPIFEAKYPGSHQQLKEYLKENTVDKISEMNCERVALAKARFHIDEDGKVSNVHISTTSENDKVDALIIQAICSMPKWKPAENSKGIKVAQEFEFSMGTDLLRCDYTY